MNKKPIITKGMFTNATDEWATPQSVFDELNAEFNFTLDPCATKDNAKCERFFTKDQDGLSKSWENEIVYCNPPYGRVIGNWVKKAYEESKKGSTVVMLIPARTDTKWFHDYIYRKQEIRFIRGRLRFNGVNSNAPFPSMIVVFKGGETN